MKILPICNLPEYAYPFLKTKSLPLHTHNHQNYSGIFRPCKMSYVENEFPTEQ